MISSFSSSEQLPRLSPFACSVTEAQHRARRLQRSDSGNMARGRTRERRRSSSWTEHGKSMSSAPVDMLDTRREVARSLSGTSAQRGANKAGGRCASPVFLRENGGMFTLTLTPCRVGVRFLTSWSLLAFYGSEC